MQKKDEIKDDLKYISIGCSLASDSEMSGNLIKNGLIDTILDVFDHLLYPNEVYQNCLMPIACFSKSEEGKQH